MTPQLAGQLIGSIRRVRFVAAGPATATTDHDAAPRQGTACFAIEIETKSGRYAHLVAGACPGSLRWVPGPFRPPDDLPTQRDWADLTAALPVAFDGRPRIVAVTPVDPLPHEHGHPAARAWRIDLSTGTALTCTRADGDVEIRALAT
jgi:hypothetical protein